MTDPGAIDLEKIKFHHGRATRLTVFEVDSLIAAVEALREQKVELAEHLDKTIYVAADAVNRMNAAETRITELEKELVETQHG